jgi:hypothetical protein
VGARGLCEEVAKVRGRENTSRTGEGSRAGKDVEALKVGNGKEGKDTPQRQSGVCHSVAGQPGVSGVMWVRVGETVCSVRATNRGGIGKR